MFFLCYTRNTAANNQGELMDNEFSRIILGTVQFGLPYGNGEWEFSLMPKEKVFAILDKAWAMGIKTLDTSPDYGFAEQRIAQYLSDNPSKHFNIISKIKSIPQSKSEICNAFKNWFANCPYLKSSNLNSLSVLLHNENHIYDNNIVEHLNELKFAKKVTNWGASIYKTDAAKRALATHGCSIVELPFGFLNQQIKREGFFDENMPSNKKIIARSIFTKGALFRIPNELANSSKDYSKVLHELKIYLNEVNIGIGQFGIMFALSQPKIKNVVVGVDDIEQLSELSIPNNFSILDRMPVEVKKFAENLDGVLSRPENWPNKN